MSLRFADDSMICRLRTTKKSIWKEVLYFYHSLKKQLMENGTYFENVESLISATTTLNCEMKDKD